MISIVNRKYGVADNHVWANGWKCHPNSNMVTMDVDKLLKLTVGNLESYSITLEEANKTKKWKSDFVIKKENKNGKAVVIYG